ncbi:hypothetical protein SAMN05421595_0058 [Austwickia chelonae]|uniref:Uncharacterized protein n=1 Tax=Austwickia chelonae NBRC 105200 TaxID=1184607 RepID=K6WAH9_9MICO|nr:hypothetical protein [Austwickia chelonae]GAB78847.1 hypothetical protein AUCHE_17_00590 [Austwickia chelonae NBRC 105200]SEV85239.1 hypothetical protein SAMN05421595_0058 [Austwickia chelonae]
MKGLTDAKPAALLLALMLVTGLSPARLASAIGDPTSTVPQNHRESFAIGKKGDRVEFLAPAGWERTAMSNSNTLTYTKDKNVMKIILLPNVADREIGVRRHIQTSAQNGELIQIEDEKTRTPNGFEGHSCIVSNRDNSRRGSCAIVGRGDFLIKVVSTTERGSDPLPLEAVVTSLTFKEAK